MHEGAHIRSAKFLPDGNIWSYIDSKTKCPQEKKAADDMFPLGLLSGLFCQYQLFFVGSDMMIKVSGIKNTGMCRMR